MSIQLDIGTALSMAKSLLMAQGVPENVAYDVAEHLVESDRVGYASHGISILPSYQNALKMGTLKADAPLECIRDRTASLGYDAHLGFGQHAAKVAFQNAIAQAHEFSICALTLRYAHHIGRTGFYGEMVTKAGMALLAFTNIVKRKPTVAPFGGAKARLTTNPVCFAWPMPNGRPPFLLDLATSAIALNKARVLAAQGKQAPPDALIDAQGNPTTDPNVMLQDPPGALLTFGAHKGYGLGVAVELFAGILSGGGTIHKANHGTKGMAVNNIFALIVNIDRFATKAWAASEAETFVEYLKSCPPQPGSSGVQYPGEYEAANKAKNSQTIVLDDASWQALQKMGTELQVSIPEVKPI